ncbi:MAG: hypothetical protein EPO28_15390 [Saprospiraceae bacterium]|nr:MAG: hypothetical protein EPO28_15390 [Saprospiraceae bacterium]
METTDAQKTALLLHLFGDQEETLRLLAPDGWLNNPLLRLRHPTAEQQYQEAVRFQENLCRLFRKKKPEQEASPPPQRSDFEDDHLDDVRPLDELRRLLGDCTWLVFSNNHTVTGPEGEEYNLGSFRGSGGFIADFLNEHYPSEKESFDYMDFYCAGAFTFGRADTTPVFELLFQRLKEKGCDWTYSFPRIHLVDFSGLREADEKENPAEYDPAAAMQKELERAEKRRESERLKRELDEAYEQAFEEAKYQPPPPEVAAYRKVFGRLPEGFPGS